MCFCVCKGRRRRRRGGHRFSKRDRSSKTVGTQEEKAERREEMEEEVEEQEVEEVVVELDEEVVEVMKSRSMGNGGERESRAGGGTGGRSVTRRRGGSHKSESSFSYPLICPVRICVRLPWQLINAVIGGRVRANSNSRETRFPVEGFVTLFSISIRFFSFFPVFRFISIYRVGRCCRRPKLPQTSGY